jgi:hypothetical protein
VVSKVVSLGMLLILVVLLGATIFGIVWTLGMVGWTAFKP